MASEAELEKLLSDGDWGAVKTAQALGQAAWPTLEKGSRMADYRSRQITMACAGRLGGAHAASILVAGLADSFINVRLAAAGQLSGSPPPHALDGILDVLTTSSEDDVCQLLALAAGRLPSSRTTRVLLSVAPRQDAVGENAQLALAKLGNQEYIQAHLVKLSSDAPATRYRALAELIYIADPALASHAMELLADRRAAQRIGHERAWRYRRVCDQALDTVVSLRDLKPNFPTGPEQIYSDAQLAEIARHGSPR